jgi:[acyl-carrier-protein] S-malonyltransferase
VAKAVIDRDAIKSNLIDQLTGAVRWTQSVQKMIAEGLLLYRSWIGKVLQGLVLKIDKTMVVQGVS